MYADHKLCSLGNLQAESGLDQHGSRNPKLISSETESRRLWVQDQPALCSKTISKKKKKQTCPVCAPANNKFCYFFHKVSNKIWISDKLSLKLMTVSKKTVKCWLVGVLWRLIGCGFYNLILENNIWLSTCIIFPIVCNLFCTLLLQWIFSVTKVKLLIWNEIFDKSIENLWTAFKNICV